MIDLSIVIVNWNTRDLLAQCLHSVYNTTSNLDFEVIVVDNASTDGSPEMVRQAFPDVSLIANTENLGFAKANNQAIRRSRGRYVLLLNSDAFVRENTIECMVAFMDGHPEAGMAGCKLLVVSTYSARFTATTSLFMGAESLGLTRNLRKLGMYTLYGWSVALLPLAVYGLVRLWRRQLTVQWERALFLLA